MTKELEGKIEEILNETEIDVVYPVTYERIVNNLLTLVEESNREAVEDCVKLVQEIKNSSDENGSVDWFNALHCVIATLNGKKGTKNE